MLHQRTHLLFLVLLLAKGVFSNDHGISEENGERSKASPNHKQDCVMKETDSEESKKTKYFLPNVARSITLKLATPSTIQKHQQKTLEKFTLELETELNTPEFWDKAFPVVSREELTQKKTNEFNKMNDQVSTLIQKINTTAIELEKEYGGPFKEIAHLSNPNETSIWSSSLTRFIENYLPTNTDETFAKKISSPFTQIESIESKLATWGEKKLNLEREIKILRKKRNELDYIYPRSSQQEDELDEAKRKIEELADEIGEYQTSISALTTARPSRDLPVKDPEVQKFIATHQKYFKGWSVIINALDEWQGIEEQHDLRFPQDSTLVGQKQDGTTFPIDISMSGWSAQGERYVTAIMRDVTEKVKAAKALQKLNENLEIRVQERTQELSASNNNLYREILRREQTEKDLVRAREAAIVASKLKSDFVANISHEIRTPINAVIGCASLLQDTPLNHEQLEYVNSIRVAVDSLLAIVNDVLDFSKIEAGKMSLEPINFNFHDLLNATTDMFRQLASRKGLLVTLKIDETVPKGIHSDPGRIRQVLTNLLGNAVKFTERGNIDVVVSLQENAPEGSTIRVTVKDQGLGIPKEQISQLFRPFSQGDTSATRKHGGTGLGLSISKRLTELLGGEIGVESEVGHGTLFWFTIKARRTLVAVTSPEKETASLFKQQGKGRILVVDDTAMNLKVTIRMLEKLGFHADPAGNGREAIEAVFARKYDLVLMDCQMPDIDGYEATAKIRKLEKNNTHIPIIALTAHAAAEEREKCLNAGMDDYLSKPVDPERLSIAVFKWIKPDKKAA